MCTEVLFICTIALVECHKNICPTLKKLGIDIKTDDLAHFLDFGHLGTSCRHFDFGPRQL